MNMLSLAASKHGDLSIDIWLFARGLGTGNIDIDWKYRPKYGDLRRTLAKKHQDLTEI